MTTAQNPASEQTSLAIVPPAERAALALNSSKTEADLRALAQSSADIVAVLDDNGRDQAHRIYMTLRTARTAIRSTAETAREDAVSFQRAVIAEEKRLIGLITPEETRILALRDEYDAEQERIQAEKVAAERARMEAHEANIAAISRMPLECTSMPAAEVMAVIDAAALKWHMTTDTWEEYAERAATAYAEAVEALQNLYRTKLAAEEEAQRAKDAQEAERVRLAAEAAHMEQVRAELAAAQARLDQDRREQEAREAKAEAERLTRIAAEDAERRRVAAAEDAERQRKADEAAAELKRQADALAAEREAFASQQLAARVAEELARDHAEALEMNAIWQPAPVVEPAHSTEAIADALIAESVAALEPLGVLADLASDTEPTDSEIVCAYVDAFGGSAEAAIERLARFSAQYVTVAA